MEDVSRGKLHPLEEEIDLPSRGKLYGDKLPDGKVLLRPMTLSEEKLLLSTRSDRLSLLDDILDRCLLTRSLTISEYLVGDKCYLLLILRVISYGRDYTFDVSCHKCRHAFVHKVELPESLSVRYLEDEDTEPFTVKLPVSGHTVGLRHLRGADEREIEKVAMKAKRTHDEVGEALVSGMMLSIVTIDDEEAPTMEKKLFVEGLMSKDSVVLRSELHKHECGPVLDISVDCPSCGAPFKELLPLTTEFFRPGDTEEPE